MPSCWHREGSCQSKTLVLSRGERLRAATPQGSPGWLYLKQRPFPGWHFPQFCNAFLCFTALTGASVLGSVISQTPVLITVFLLSKGRVTGPTSLHLKSP